MSSHARCSVVEFWKYAEARGRFLSLSILQRSGSVCRCRNGKSQYAFYAVTLIEAETVAPVSPCRL